MSDDGGKAPTKPVRLSPEAWLDKFTDFGKITLHPDPPFLRREPLEVDTPTLQLKRVRGRE